MKTQSSRLFEATKYGKNLKIQKIMDGIQELEPGEELQDLLNALGEWSTTSYGDLSKMQGEDNPLGSKQNLKSWKHMARAFDILGDLEWGEDEEEEEPAEEPVEGEDEEQQEEAFTPGVDYEEDPDFEEEEESYDINQKKSKMKNIKESNIPNHLLDKFESTILPQVIKLFGRNNSEAREEAWADFITKSVEDGQATSSMANGTMPSCFEVKSENLDDSFVEYENISVLNGLSDERVDYLAQQYNIKIFRNVDPTRGDDGGKAIDSVIPDIEKQEAKAAKINITGTRVNAELFLNGIGYSDEQISQLHDMVEDYKVDLDEEEDTDVEWVEKNYNVLDDNRTSEDGNYIIEVDDALYKVIFNDYASVEAVKRYDYAATQRGATEILRAIQHRTVAEDTTAGDIATKDMPLGKMKTKKRLEEDLKLGYSSKAILHESGGWIGEYCANGTTLAYSTGLYEKAEEALEEISFLHGLLQHGVGDRGIRTQMANRVSSIPGARHRIAY